MAAVNGMGLGVGTAPIVDTQSGQPLNQFRQLLINIIGRVKNLGVTGWTAPTGTGSRASFDADWTTTVSNPPTQAEVAAIRDQLIAVQKATAQLITDLQSSGVFK